MNYTQIQNATIADLFGEPKRSDAKEWINSEYQAIWDLEQWAFKTATSSVTATAGNQTLSGVPGDFGTALMVFGSDGSELRPFEDVRAFYSRYGDTTQRGAPEAFTVLGSSTILVGPTPDADRTLTLVYEKALTPLVNGTDVPAIPPGYHMLLVLGARRRGASILKMPVYDSEHQEYVRLLESMRRNHISAVLGGFDQVGAYRPDRW